MQTLRCDILILGSGPAGLAAALAAASCGKQVVILDDNPRPGGQIWREGPQVQLPALARRYREAVAAEKNICGARELSLPFPGWTLPGVTGAGGLQAQIKHGLTLRGQKVVIAGSGPLLLAVAATVKKSGGEVRQIVEQAPLSALLRFGSSLWR